MTGDRWQVTGDRWQVTPEMWYVTHAHGHEDDPQKVCVVIQVEDDAKVAAFMAENEASILESGHLLHTTESNTYL